MFCGDETGGLVVDVGSYNARFGFSGEDTPKSVFNSWVGVTGGAMGSSSSGSVSLSSPKHYVGLSARTPRAGMEVSHTCEFGIVEDFEALDAIWSHGFDSLRVSPREHPVVLVEPGYTLPQQREKQAEMMFEGQGVPFLYLARAPVCQAFSTGRACALVLDIGASCTRVTPVTDGHVLRKGHIISEVGGTFVSNALNEALYRGGHFSGEGGSSSSSSSSSGGIQPRALVGKVKNTGGGSGSSSAGSGMMVEEGGGSGSGSGSGSSSSSSSSSGSLATGARPPTFLPKPNTVAQDLCSKTLRRTLVLEVLDDMKESCLHVAEIGYDASRPCTQTSYELPDGTMLHLKDLRESVTEVHFRPEVLAGYKNLLLQRQTPGWYSLHSADVLGKRSHGGTGITAQPYPLHHLIHQSLLNSQPLLRKELCHNILLTGGGSLLSGLSKRLYWESLTLIPAAFKPRILTATPLERKFSSWIGGSILGSLGTFQQLWVSKQEYQEFGPGIISERCP